MTKRTLGILIASIVLAFGCEERQSFTAPPTPFNRLLIRVTLSRLEPAAGVKHTVLAKLVLVAREKPVELKDVVAYNYRGTAQVVVSGFTPSRLEAHGSARFDVTLTSRDDIPCADELIVEVAFDDGEEGSVGTFYDCRDEEWFF